MLGAPLDRRARVHVALPRWIGDAIEVEPAVAALVEHVGAERVILGASGGASALYRAHFPELEQASPARGQHDVAVLFPGSFRSAWTVWRAGIARRAGWATDGRGWLLTDSLTPALERGAPPLGVGRVGRWPRRLPRPVGVAAVELLGALGVPVTRRAPSFEPSSDARAWATRALGERTAPVVVNLGARAGSSKGFPTDFAARLVEALASDQLVAVCAPLEHSIAERALQASGASIPLLEPDLDGLLALFERAAVVVTPDGGARHLAALVGAPRVVAFASTDPRHSADAGRGAERRFEARVACGPCHRERCPLVGDAHLACWNTVEPEALAEAARELTRRAASE